MSKTQIFVQQADGTAREVEIASGGVLLLNADEHLFIAASSDQAQVETGAPGEVIIKLEGVGEFTVESAEEIPEQIAMAPEIMGIKPLPTIVFEPTRTDLSDDAPTHEPLGVHQARVDSTAFLDRQTGDDFGMGQLLDMATFSGMAGEGLAGRKGADDTDEDDMLADSLDDGLSGDPGQDHRNLPPVIDINKTLLVDDDATESLLGHLRATDRESGSEDLRFRISQGPVYGVLMVDGEEVDASRVTFTQADLDSGRVTFRFVPHSQNKVLVLEGDTFVFTVTDGVNTTGPATFRIQNTTVQVWGTDGDDDLTNVANFDRDGSKFHVYGFDGNDTLRGGSGADTLDGGGHASTDFSLPGQRFSLGITVPGATPGGDTVDYGASNAAVDVDLTRTGAQSGGHAEGDVLRGIENVTGSRFGDTLRGDGGNNVLAGLAGADLLDGGAGTDTADYRRSNAAVDVDLTRTGGQSGGHAEGDTLIGIENVIGSAFADSIVGNDGHNFLDGGAGNDTLLGGAGNDTLRGGSGADYLDGGTGPTNWRGEMSHDLADYSASDAAVNVDLTRTGAQSGGHAEGDTLVGIEDVLGSRFNDVIKGDAKDNRLWGGDGDDSMYGGSRYDTIMGGSGNDWIDGGTHADSLFGGAGNDTIYGGNGIDTIFGGDGDDYLVGYNPDGSADKEQDLLIGGWGNDTLDASHQCGSSWSTLVGGSGADMLIGNGTTTSASYELTGRGEFEINYGPGVYLDLRRQGKDEEGNLRAQIDPFGRKTDAVGDTLIGIVNAGGTCSSDTIIGNHQNNEFYGLDGEDLLVGGEGNDSLWGVNGNDTLEGGAGADFMWGGMGIDIITYENATSGVNVDLRGMGPVSGAYLRGAGEENGDEVWYCDGIIGSNYDDTLIASDNYYAGYISIDNLLEGRGGNDLIMGLKGHDTLDGGAGNDTLIGGEGNDLLLGGAGDDLIHAGAGDKVDGGAGFDTLLSEDEHLNVASSTSLTNIERIDLTGAGKSLAVNGDAIVKNGVADPAGSGLMALVVTGDEGDTIHFAGDNWAWTLLDGVRDLGDGKTYRLYEAVKDGQTVRMYVETQVGADSDLNDAPIIACNTLLLVDDDATESLTEHLRTTDDTAGPADLKYFVTHAPAYGELYLNGEPATDFSAAVFTQDDLDNGRVTFRFVPHAQDTTLVLEDDTFVFTVTDGVNTTGPATFRIHNTTVQVWGTGNGDDLTGVANFDRADTKFHVYGFDGNDTMRGGSGADTLDGGGHAYASHSPWLYTQEGGDTVDYGASTAAVDIDLNRETQSGGHAEGDALIGIENVIGSAFADSIVGNAASNHLVGLAGNDTLIGGAGDDTLRGGAGLDQLDGGVGRDFADYRDSESWVNVDLTKQDGLTAQSGGGAGNHADGDTLIGIENVIGSAFADSIVGDAGSNHLIGLGGDDTLIGGAGNDTFVGGAGADRQDGGTGTRDLADYSASTAWVNVDLNKQDGTTAQTGGGAGNHAEGDILTGIEDVNGSAYDDSILGNAGSNVIYSYGGNDTIDGGAGYDTINGGDGDDLISGGNNEDMIYGGAGNDTVYGGNGIDTIFGGDGDDYLVGYNPDGSADRNQDLLIGGWGNDTLDASHECGRSWSTLVGGMGADRLIGNGTTTSASYELTGHGDFNVSWQGVYLDLRLQGLDADGNLMVQPGKPGGDDATGDILTGIVNAVGSNGHDTLIGNHQNNEMYGVDGNDLMIGGEGNDSLWGVNNNDTLEGGLGADFLWGGMDYDIASYANAASGVNVSLEIQNGPTQSGAGEENGDELWYMDGLWGSEFNDTLTGRSTDDPDYMSIHNLIEGRGGDDIISGLAGNDTLIGGEGDDLLLGGAGDDLIHAGAGDTVDGGEGYDTLISEDERLDVASSTSITNIERIDLTGACKGLTVSGGAILLNGVADPAGSGLMALVVNGDADDLVIRRSDGWTWTMADPDATVDGVAYVLYEGMQDGQTVRLYVQANVASVDELTVSEVFFEFDPPMTITDGPGYDDGFLALLNSAISSDVVADDPNSSPSISIELTVSECFELEPPMPCTEGPCYDTLTLKASDVLDTTGGTDTLWVSGDANDAVTTTDTGWTHVGVETGADGQLYNHYSGYAGSTLVNLMIDADLANQNVMHA